MPQSTGDDKTEPSLELPSLKLPGLGRKRRRKADEPAEQLQPPVTAAAGETWDREATQALPLNGAGEHTSPPVTPAVTVAGPRRTKAERKNERRAERTRPVLPGWLAACLTGLLVGAAGAAGTYAAMAGCEAVRGVSTCGGAPGFFILVAIVVLMVLLGAGLLKAFGVQETVSTSFLAVGLVTVLVMLLLLDVIFSASMFAVIPVLTAAAYLLAHWVTTRFEGEDTGRRDWR